MADEDKISIPDKKNEVNEPEIAYMLKKIVVQYLLGIGLALLLIPVSKGTLALFPNIDYEIFTVFYIAIVVFQIIFYYLTTNYKLGWTVLSFILNFILWTFEQVQIYKNFEDSFIYKENNYGTEALILGGLLWVTNKILIDKLFGLNKSINKHDSKIKV